MSPAILLVTSLAIWKLGSGRKILMDGDLDIATIIQLQSMKITAMLLAQQPIWLSFLVLSSIR
jgi:hypothetical protein